MIEYPPKPKLSKSATAEEIELRIQCGRFRNLTAKLTTSANLNPSHTKQAHYNQLVILW